MKPKRRIEERCWAGTVAVIAAGLLLSPAVQAQEPGGVTIDVSDCVDLEKPEERLACFEREIEAQRRATPAPAANRSQPAPAATAPTPQRAVVPAAVPAPVAAERGRERDRRVEPLPADVVAKVAQLRETVPNTWTITLDNGQVWRQTTPKPIALRPGMEVRLSPTNWGSSYRLTAPALRIVIQVERVR